MKQKESKKKEAILREGFKLFLSRGYDAVSFTDIERAANVTRGAIFHHFENKEDLFNQVADQFVFDFLKQNERLIGDTDSPTPLKTFLDICIDEVQKRMRLFIETFGETVTSASFMSFIFYPSWSEKVQEYEKLEIAMWDKVLKQAKEKGEVRNDIEEGQLIAVFRGLYLGLSYKGALIDRLSIEELRKLWEFIYQQVVN